MTARGVDGGIACPACGSDRLVVMDSRPTLKTVRRRRKCAGCGKRVTTLERIYDGPIPDSIDRQWDRITRAVNLLMPEMRAMRRLVKANQLIKGQIAADGDDR